MSLLLSNKMAPCILGSHSSSQPWPRFESLRVSWLFVLFIGTTPGLRAANLGDSSWVATSDLTGASNHGDSSAASDPVDDPANSGDTSSVAVSDLTGT
jgi:hypothetical protein